MARILLALLCILPLAASFGALGTRTAFHVFHSRQYTASRRLVSTDAVLLHGRRASVCTMRDAEDSSKLDSSKLSLPNLSTALLGLLVIQSGYSLLEAVPKWLGGDGGEFTRVVLDVGFGGFAVLNLIKATGITGKYSYGNLDDRQSGSFAREAGAFALAGEVPKTSADGFECATMAGGCFWGTELHFQRLPGVVATCVGYTQGSIDRPTYAQVCSGTTGHTEGIQLIFDPALISYEALCEKLISTVDPTALNRVGNDRGTQYRHGLYPHTAEQGEVARQCVARAQAMAGERPVVTEVEAATIFYPAENYHQRYLEKGGQDASKGAMERVRCYG